MIPLLSRFNNITVMTNSLHIVNALSEFDSEQTILMPGGTFRKNPRRFTGSWRRMPSTTSASISCLWARTASTSTRA